jgi:hypothetical protein
MYWLTTSTRGYGGGDDNESAVSTTTTSTRVCGIDDNINMGMQRRRYRHGDAAADDFFGYFLVFLNLFCVSKLKKPIFLSFDFSLSTGSPHSW